MASPVYNSGQPFLHNISGGFSPGKIAHISGSFTPSVSSIIIKFQTGPYGDPSDDIGLCLYGRRHESVLGCNFFSRTAGWGQEEAKPTSFLVGSSQFDITILCDPIQFKIAVNREHFSEFNHKLDPSRLNHLNIVSGSNDVILNCVWIEGQSVGNVPNVAGIVPGPAYQSAPYASSSGPQLVDGGQHGHKNKGLLGMVSSAGAAVAGALGANHLLGSKGKTYGNGTSHQGGYPSNSQHGYGRSNPMGGNLAGSAMALGSGVVAAKTYKKGFSGKNMLKYGVPLAGAGLGGYALSKAFSNSFDCSFDNDHFGGCGSDSGGGSSGCDSD